MSGELPPIQTGPDPAGPRYQVLRGSDSAHCCFEATVIDTGTPVMLSVREGPPRQLRSYEWVCECMEAEDAQRVAAALNATEART